jgi:hypothetical protein
MRHEARAALQACGRGCIRFDGERSGHDEGHRHNEGHDHDPHPEDGEKIAVDVAVVLRDVVLTVMERCGTPCDGLIVVELGRSLCFAFDGRGARER